jgi:radical SAM/Cys-rich protein
MDTNEQLRIIRNSACCISFKERFERSSKKHLAATKINVLQINVGKRCNLSCRHCHVDAGTDRTEIMSREILSACLEIAKEKEISTIDITGGSPEMNPHLEWFLCKAGKLGKRLIVRSNLVILLEDAYAGFIDVYAKNGAEVVTSLPGYHDDGTNRQRGSGTFSRIIQAMKLLNQKDYGREGSRLVLNIVHNPVGAYRPGAQKALEDEYKKKLFTEHGVVFNRLFCITNMPVGRYLEYLLTSGNFEDYMAGLCGAYNPLAAENVMCRSSISVGWDGVLYDCDFNQMLGLRINHGMPDTVMDFNIEKLRLRQIVIGNHCYGCTAGTGSSCQGNTVAGADLV